MHARGLDFAGWPAGLIGVLQPHLQALPRRVRGQAQSLVGSRREQGFKSFALLVFY